MSPATYLPSRLMPTVLILAEQTSRTNSGMGVYTYEVTRRLVPYLISRGVGTCVVVRDDAEHLQKEVEDQGSDTLVLPVSNSPKWKRLWDLSQLNVKQSFDLLYSTDFKIPRRLRSIPYVPTIHDLCGLECPGEFGLLKKTFVGNLNRPVMQQASKVIAISQQTCQCIEKFYGIPSTDIQIIYNGFNAIASDQEHPFPDGVPSKEPYFLFPGRISPRKNFPTILRALKELLNRDIDCNLVHAGPPGWGNESDYTLLQSLDLESRYIQLGYVSEEKLHALYSHAKALVYPSHCEGFGLPILEALSAGCPAIVASGTASEEIGGEFVSVVAPNDAVGLSQRMEQAIREPQSFQANPSDLQAHLASFDWEKTASQVGDLLINQLN